MVTTTTIIYLTVWSSITLEISAYSIAVGWSLSKALERFIDNTKSGFPLHLHMFTNNSVQNGVTRYDIVARGKPSLCMV